MIHFAGLWRRSVQKHLMSIVRLPGMNARVVERLCASKVISIGLVFLPSAIPERLVSPVLDLFVADQLGECNTSICNPCAWLCRLV